jgi:hypothetical protein
MQRKEQLMKKLNDQKALVDVCPKCESDDLERLAQYNEVKNSYIVFKCLHCQEIWKDISDEYFDSDQIFDNQVNPDKLIPDELIEKAVRTGNFPMNTDTKTKKFPSITLTEDEKKYFTQEDDYWDSQNLSMKGNDLKLEEKLRRQKEKIEFLNDNNHSTHYTIKKAEVSIVFSQEKMNIWVNTPFGECRIRINNLPGNRFVYKELREKFKNPGLIDLDFREMKEHYMNLE